MQEKLKKYGKYLFSFAGLSALLGAPLAAGAIDWTTNLTAVAGVAGISGTTPLTSIIGAIIGTILAILGVLLVILILYAGFMWMTAQGDPAKVKKAKDIIIQAIIGLLIVFAAYAITNFVMTSLVSVSGGQVPTGAL